MFSGLLGVALPKMGVVTQPREIHDEPVSGGTDAGLGDRVPFLRTVVFQVVRDLPQLSEPYSWKRTPFA
jgi:hypothetical protein